MFAASSNTFPRFWFLTIDKDVPKGTINYDETVQFIQTVLDDQRGWSRKGYTFHNITSKEGLKTRKNKMAQRYILHLRISTEKTVDKECGFGGLSCANLGKNVVLFNLNRWLYGSQESSLPLHHYRVYVINHEIGHLLSRGHRGCSRIKMDKCPIMYQQTISKGCCIPNIFPLDDE